MRPHIGFEYARICGIQQPWIKVIFIHALKLFSYSLLEILNKVNKFLNWFSKILHAFNILKMYMLQRYF